jgi:lysine/ornithine N-monooxygenase
MGMAAAECDVVVVGAGPYGLSAAAYLGRGRGREVQVFGRTMSFWDEQMPERMLLRSPYVASNIADPAGELCLDAYAGDTGRLVDRPVPLEHFVEYGRWVQQHVAPGLDERPVRSIDRANGGLRLTLGDGSSTTANTVVVAAGIGRFARIPELFSGLPEGLVSHASAHRDLSVFAGRDVVVVGGGQSALESGALLHEAGAQVEVLVREPRVYFLRRVPRLHRLGPHTRLVFAPAEVGPAGLSRVVSAPQWYRRMPRTWQDRGAVRSLRPAGAAWLVSRLADVPVSTSREVVAARPQGDRLHLELAGGWSKTTDHVMLATGYEVDVARYEFLAPDLVAQLDRVGGFPRLGAGFASSIPGLHFIGAPAAWSFGPLLRFVAGTEFAGPELSRVLGRTPAGR